MALSVDFSITVTLCPKLNRMDITKQYDYSAYEVEQTLKRIDYVDSLTLVAEITKNCNLHFHGIIKFNIEKHKHIIYKFKNDLKEYNFLIGFIDIKQITDFPGWKEYISKDLQTTKEVIGRRPVLIDDFNCFTTEQMCEYGTMFIG